ncbi:MAG: hypothetical protein DI586_02425 [Micavibrio aeruginosavorus]|uniref:DUF983 domain-containing protein n=1 Tax=Micavibrio aeruginosavorus TaxID=349221 RepID=A0A2W5HFA5_9BACT|nr:MAG: hypothetical protein DI586_02425 [Micavibrio aeruginosavorus]
MSPDQPPSLSEPLSRGFKGNCPSCGEGRIFESFLKVRHSCTHCGEELHHHRADDLPAYYVILIVGHIIVTAALSVEFKYHPSYWVHLAIWLPLTVTLSLLLLQPIKGAITALQWHTGMHGFKHAKALRDSARKL